MVNPPKTKIFLDTYHPMLNGKCSVKLEVYFDGKRKHYLTGHTLSKLEYDKSYSASPGKELKEAHEEIVFFEANAKEIIKDLKEKFSYPLFEKRFFKQKGISTCVFILMAQKVEKLKKDGRISTATNIFCASSSLEEFVKPKLKLLFDDINVEFLNEYEKWMIKRGRAMTTIGMYLREIRTLFNEAIKDHAISQEIYPFKGNESFVIPTGRNLKRPIEIDDIMRILSFKTKTNTEERNRDLWIFSYLGNGMNIKDMIQLKYKNVTYNSIIFERAKTARANKKEPILIEFVIRPEAAAIIKKWGNSSENSNNYIFPILDNDMTFQEAYNRKHYFLKSINKTMKQIGLELGILTKLTTYVTRHSFTNTLIKNGGDLILAKESLGHASQNTTQHYISNISSEGKKKLADGLLKY